MALPAMQVLSALCGCDHDMGMDAVDMATRFDHPTDSVSLPLLMDFPRSSWKMHPEVYIRTITLSGLFLEEIINNPPVYV